MVFTFLPKYFHPVFDILVLTQFLSQHSVLFVVFILSPRDKHTFATFETSDVFGRSNEIILAFKIDPFRFRGLRSH